MKEVNEFGVHLTALAREHGFLLAAPLDLDEVLAVWPSHIARLDRYLDQGFEGEMSYLRRGRDKRADPRLLFPKAEGVLCVAAYYGGEEENVSTNPADGARYSRYLRGRDYHDVLRDRLEGVLREAAQRCSFEYKICVDSSAVLERSLAYLAGFGWIGKNACLIHPEFGSYLFLAEAFLSVSPGGSPDPKKNQCGLCTRCQEACPARAFARPGVVDARRCLSYRTLVEKGCTERDDNEKKALGNRVAGCDECQSVCPFNGPAKNKNGAQALEEFRDAETDATRLVRWEDLLSETESEYRRRVKHSALSNLKHARFRTNLARSLGSSAQHLEANRQEGIVAHVKKTIETEKDPMVRNDWGECLSLLERTREGRRE